MEDIMTKEDFFNNTAVYNFYNGCYATYLNEQY